MNGLRAGSAQRTPGRFGLIGGVGPDASSDLYMRVVAEYQSRMHGAYPDVVMHSIPLPSKLEQAFVRGHFDAAEESEVDRLLTQSLDVLEGSGATCVGLACNTLHTYLRPLVRERGIHLLDMIDAALCRLRDSGHRRVLLLATAATVRSGLYSDRADEFGVEIVAPDKAGQSVVQAAIMDLLRFANPDGPAAAMKKYAATIPTDIDAVLYGCTDLTALRDHDIFSVPVVDSLSCLTDACVDFLSRDVMAAASSEARFSNAVPMR
ncbi:amino acid racemase [Streptomyces sp. SCA3-4]|uniref:aspartate/glutamate racemase family protein n=1 Tax=Streptomyces sichuanensis TaxID=2871810 RepID=UPI001CE29001|nr:amino acid racemase [Streptomyces sichuanensis]MCA6095467.1 amino acid racemase [Streptomyces sichuanensis]